MKGDICIIDGCSNEVRSGSICQVHWWRMNKYGNYKKPSRKRFPNICRAKGCEKLRDGRHSVCSMHRSRLSRFKSLDLPVFNYPEGIFHECKIHGYLKIEEVYKNPKTDHYSCIKCRRENEIKFSKDNPDLDKNAYKKSFYVGKERIKVDKNYYDFIYKKQNGLCAICNKNETSQHPTKKFGEKTKRLAIDHCHATKKVRGLLCQMCNQALGSFKDSITILESAIKYLRKSNETKTRNSQNEPCTS